MKNEEIDELITTVQNVPIVKKFYELKKEGKCPRILVHQVEGKDEIDYARLQLPEIDLYFHNSGSEKVEKIESEFPGLQLHI